MVVAVLVFAGVAGVLVAQVSGQRGEGTLTGNSTDLRGQLASCQPLALKSPKQGIPCYQKILDQSPDNLDALTYQAWAYVRDGQVAKGGRSLQRVVALDPDYPDARVFRAIIASRAGDFTQAAAEVDRFYRNKPSQVAVQVLDQEGLERTIFFGLISPATSACWATAAKESPSKSGIDQAFLDRLGTCLDTVLAAAPTDKDALLSKALTLIGPDHQDIAGAESVLNRVLAADPNNGNALLLRTSLALAQKRFDDAQADLHTLAGLPRPTASFLIGSSDQLQQALDAGRRAESASTTTVPGGSTSTTTPSVSTSTVPGAPVIPNAGGG